MIRYREDGTVDRKSNVTSWADVADALDAANRRIAELEAVPVPSEVEAMARLIEPGSPGTDRPTLTGATLGTAATMLRQLARDNARLTVGMAAYQDHLHNGCGCRFDDDGETVVKECGAHKAMRETAEAALATVTQDAERYRWLRDDPRGRALSMSALEWQAEASLANAAIDAAIAAKGRA